MSMSESDSQSYSDGSDPYAGGARLEEVDDAEPLDHVPGQARAPSPRSLVPSFGSNGKDTYHRSRKGDRRRSSTHRELVKILAKEEFEVKQVRQVLSAALDRLDRETFRAQEAERRALELAERFKVVNDARLAAQLEASRLNEELSLYKFQLTHAQHEIDRGSELLRNVENQRDDAEASAARARSIARKLKEEQLMSLAREEGRRQGYEEGQRRGYEEGKLAAYGRRRQREANGQDDEDDNDPTRADGYTAPLNELGPEMLNFTSPPTANAPFVERDDPIAPLPPPTGTYNFDGGGAQGSRFRENMSSPGVSTLSSLPLPLRAGPQPWPSSASQSGFEFDRSSIAQDGPSTRRASFVPPDGYIPPVNSDNNISLPAPHQLNDLPMGDPLPQARRPPSVGPTGGVPLIRPSSSSSGIRARDYAFADRQRTSPRSVAQSLASTSLSTFELLTSPQQARRSGLSMIPEVSASMEMSPGTTGRVQSTSMPEPTIFPEPSVGFNGGPPDDPIRSSTPRGTRGPRPERSGPLQEDEDPQEEWRYSDPHEVDEWRRATADEIRTQSSHGGSQRPRSSNSMAPSYRGTTPQNNRPPSVAADRPPAPQRSRSMLSHHSDDRSYHSGAGSRRQGHSSEDISIQIEPPSGEGSILSPPVTYQSGMLSTPGAESHPLPSIQPESDHHYSSGGEFFAGGRMAAASPSIAQPSPRMSGIYAPPPGVSPGIAPQANSSGRNSASIYGRPTHERTMSHGSVNETLRPKSPRSRPASSMGGPPSNFRATSPNPNYAPAPIPAGMQYSAPPSGINPPPRVDTISPRSASSRHSGGHRRSVSLNATAGMTPASAPRPLSSNAQHMLRRVPSNASASSIGSTGLSANYSHYNPRDYVDPAFLASSEDLTNIQSPGTMANTRANATISSKQPKNTNPYTSSPSSLSFSALYGSTAY